MDGATLLVVLAVVVAVDSIATVALLVLTIRGRRAPQDIEAGPARGSAAQPAAIGPAVGSAEPGHPTSAPAQVAATPVTPAPAVDPLAGAISAFLDRREGVFTAGIAGDAGQGPPGAAAGAPPTTPLGGMPTGLSEGQPVALVARLAPARPARYVPAGPPPARPPEVPSAAPGPEPLHAPLAAPVGRGGAAAGAREPFPSQPVTASPRYRPASRLSVALAGRDGSRPEVAAEAIARLGPVIGGLLRERTRARDRVAEEGPGRFVVVLPETRLDGAEALGLRLRSTCDAWLGAETPPLRLELAAADLPGGVPGGSAESGRATGPERRRPLALET
jgi:hypothetical protein